MEDVRKSALPPNFPLRGKSRAARSSVRKKRRKDISESYRAFPRRKLKGVMGYPTLIRGGKEDLLGKKGSMGNC